jgi:uncharacterized protein YkwD
MAGCAIPISIPITSGDTSVTQLNEYDMSLDSGTPTAEAIQWLLDLTADLPGGNDGGIEDEYAKGVLDLVNVERAKENLDPLEWNSQLALAAYNHAADMASRHFFGHYTPEGVSPFDRISDAGYDYWTAGENVARGQTTPEEVVEGWMNSPGHRANIMSTTFEDLGVGYKKSATSGTIYWVQDFGSQ